MATKHRHQIANFFSEIIPIIFLFLFAHAQTFNYGDDCYGDSCDYSKNLFCINWKCDCSSPDMIYNKTIGSCVVKLSHTCVQEEYHTNQNLDFGRGLAKSVKFTRRLPCVYGAICLMSTCVCPDPDDSGTDGTCTTPYLQSNVDIQGKYNRQISISRMEGEFFTKNILQCDYTGNYNCANNTGLKCIDGTCQCSSSSQQYFNGIKCLSKANAPCSPTNSSESENNEFILECTPFSECISEDKDSYTCQCTTGFFAREDGKCMPDFNQTCDGKVLQCNKKSRLACVDGKCQCEESSRVYNGELKKCVELDGVPVSEDNYDYDSQKESKQPISIRCDYTGNKNCPAGSGLSCVDGTCKCALGDQQYFNGTKCLSLVKSVCNVNQSTDETNWECTPYANCVQVEGHSICECMERFASSETGTCVPDFGQACDDKNLLCRKGGLLACVNGKCDCETELHVYDTGLQRCRGLVGAKCQKNEDRNSDNDDAIPYSIVSATFCVEGAFCDAAKAIYRWRTTNGYCKCKTGVETVNRTCT